MTCVSCGAEASLLIGPGVLPAKAAVYRCRACGLDFFEDVADTDYWQTAGQAAIYEDPAVAAERASDFCAILDRIERLVGKGTLLDVGAGKGEFALAAAARGWQVSVVEPSAKATEGLATRGICEVHNSVFEEFAPRRAYRCVTLLDLIEHTRDPRATFLRAVGVPRAGRGARHPYPGRRLYGASGRSSGIQALAARRVAPQVPVLPSALFIHQRPVVPPRR